MDELPQLQVILDAFDDSVAVLDSNGRIVAVNARWIAICRAAGARDDCFLGELYMQYASGAPPAVQHQLGRVIRGEVQAAEIDYVMRVSESDSWFRLHARQTGDGKFVVLRHSDVTEERVAVEVAERVQLRYRELFESNQAGVILSSLGGQVLQANPAAAHIYGYATVEEFKQHNAKEFWTRSEARQALVRTLLSGRRVSSYPVEVTTPQGDKSLLISAHLVPADPEPLIETTVVDVTEWRTVVDRLRTNEEWFRQVLRNSPVIVGYQDRELRYRWIYNSVLGLKEEDVVGRTDADLFRPLTAARLTDLKRSVLDSGKPVREVVPVESAAGLMYVDLSLEPDIQDGAVVGVNGTAVNVTDRVLAEQALREREASLRTVMDFAPEAVLLADLQGIINYSNQRACDLFQRQCGEIEGESIDALTSPDGQQAARVPWREWVSGHPRVTELSITRRDGSQISAEISGVRLPDGRLQAFIRDVSERQRLESERQMMALIINSSDAAIMSSSPGGTISSWNRGAEKMLGWSAVEMIGRSVLCLVPESRREELNAIRAALLDGATLDNYRTTRRKKDGTHIEIALSAWPVRDHRGNVVGISSISRDISRQLFEERERELLQQRVERAERIASLGRLAATVAHEFNNVMMSISPFVELLRREGADPDRRDVMLRQIDGAIIRGKRITSEILRYARPQEPATSIFNVGDWLDSVAPQLRLLLPSAVHLEWQRRADDFWLNADRQQLDQVLTNLVLNARDSIGAAGTVTIIAAPADEEPLERQIPGGQGALRITLRDSGPGISREDLPRIFEPLFSTKRGGTGLGLPVAFQVVQAHGGAIWATSAPGEGAEFHVMLPAVADPLHERSTEVVAAADPLPHLEILLVEDDDEVAAGLTGLLELLGLSSQRAATGEAALELFPRQHFDLAILDVGLPDIQGTDLAAMLRRQQADLPVLFSTGHASSIGIDGGPDARTAILMKPYGLDELRHALRQLLPGIGNE